MGKSTNFNCDICPCVCKNSERLNRHKRTHQVQHFCDSCDFITAHGTSLWRHKNTFHNNTKESKYVIKRPGVYRGKIKSKFSNKTTGVLHSCKYCMFSTKHKVSLKRHVLLKHKQNAIQFYRCDYCEYKNLDYYTIKLHTRRVHKKKAAFQACAKCGEKFATLMEKKFHNWKYLKKGISCNNKKISVDLRKPCSEEIQETDETSQSDSSENDENANDDENRISESECSSHECDTPKNSRNSLPLCFDLKNALFECKVCNKQFLRESFLDKHISVAHTFIHDLHNPTSVHMKEIVATWTDVSPHKCKLCQVICISKEALFNHLKRHRFIYDDSK